MSCAGSHHGGLASLKLTFRIVTNRTRTSAPTKRGGDDGRIIRFAEAELLVRGVLAGRRSKQLHHLKQRSGLLTRPADQMVDVQITVWRASFKILTSERDGTGTGQIAIDIPIIYAAQPESATI